MTPHSTLMHLLPGLAVFAHRHYTPPALRGWRGLLGTAYRGVAAAASALFGRAAAPANPAAAAAAWARPALLPRPEPWGRWLVVAPLVFYLAWQLFYFLVVQVVYGSFIKEGGYDTVSCASYQLHAFRQPTWWRLAEHGLYTAIGSPHHM
jgi:hypothetical protein